VRVLGSETGDEIVKRRYQMLEAFYEVGKKCIDEDGAGALILLCAGLSDLTVCLEERLGVPVISGVISAVKIAEQLPSNL
jgi:allantoin racemase